jgi:multisubunit Na+/H+ antiporter MnhG subunit
MLAGVVGVVGGAWPLLTGRNFPGVLGRGFTRGDNLRLKRAPSSYFRAMGATIATIGLFVLYVGVIEWQWAGPPPTAFGLAGALIAISCFASLAWLLRVTYRYKLFRWNAP